MAEGHSLSGISVVRDRISRTTSHLKPTTLLALSFLIIACRAEQAPSQGSSATERASQTVKPQAGPSARPAAKPVNAVQETPIPAGMVDISSLKGISLDLRYRTPNNFMGEDLYGDYAGTYLHQDAAEKLEKAVAILQQERPGWKIRVFDALRPREIQQRMWAKVKGTSSSKYVADPREGSGHNYGMSVDVTLEDEHGQEVDMGTPFDDFTPLAQPRNEMLFLRQGKLTKAQYENRLLLRRVMKQAGFGPLLQEWWHFNARGIKTIKSRYAVIESAF